MFPELRILGYAVWPLSLPSCAVVGAFVYFGYKVVIYIRCDDHHSLMIEPARIAPARAIAVEHTTMIPGVVCQDILLQWLDVDMAMSRERFSSIESGEFSGDPCLDVVIPEDLPAQSGDVILIL